MNATHNVIVARPAAAAGHPGRPRAGRCVRLANFPGTPDARSVRRCRPCSGPVCGPAAGRQR